MNRSEALRAKWTALVAEQEASGLSVPKFCREHGLVASTLFAWRRKLRRPGPPGEGLTFVEATIEGEPPRRRDDDGTRAHDERIGGVRIELASGHRVVVERGFDRALLREVLTLLEEVGS